MCDHNAGLALLDTPCEQCGGEIWTKPKKDGTARKKRFCIDCRPPDPLRGLRGEAPLFITCERCGTVVRQKATGQRKKYCSSKCRSEASTFARYERVRNLKRRTVLLLFCEKCGKPFFSKRKKRFCSLDCSERSRSVTGKSREQLAAEWRKKNTRICENCGLSYVKKRRAKNEGNRFCSRTCSDAAERPERRKRTLKSKVYFPVCAGCGTRFVARSNLTKTCSDDCRAVYARLKAVEYWEEKRKAHATTKCLQCGVEFTRLYGNKAKTCSEECGAALADSSKRARKARRRARKNTPESESFDPFVVFERDQWKCQACGCDTPKELRGTLEDDAPELDHIVPLASGGQHTQDNTQCLCRVCNQLKSDKPMEEFVAEYVGEWGVRS